MPGALDNAMRSVAASLHQTFGKSVTATIATTQGYDPATGYAARDESAATVVGVVSRFRGSEVGDTIRHTDVKFTMAAQGNTAPTTEHRVTIDGADYEVVEIMPQYSGAQVAYYTLVLRR